MSVYIYSDIRKKKEYQWKREQLSIILQGSGINTIIARCIGKRMGSIKLGIFFFYSHMTPWTFEGRVNHESGSGSSPLSQIPIRLIHHYTEDTLHLWVTWESGVWKWKPAITIATYKVDSPLHRGESSVSTKQLCEVTGRLFDCMKI